MRSNFILLLYCCILHHRVKEEILLVVGYHFTCSALVSSVATCCDLYSTIVLLDSDMTLSDKVADYT